MTLSYVDQIVKRAPNDPGYTTGRPACLVCPRHAAPSCHDPRLYTFLLSITRWRTLSIRPRSDRPITSGGKTLEVCGESVLHSLRVGHSIRCLHTPGDCERPGSAPYVIIVYRMGQKLHSFHCIILCIRSNFFHTFWHVHTA